MTALFVHVGYPKTATTTLQNNLFCQHPEIDYLGKFIPSYDYIDPVLAEELNGLMTCDKAMYKGVSRLREVVDKYLHESSKRTMLISSESFIHVSAVDLKLVAERIKQAFGRCHIIITIRNQPDIIRSFYNLHGRFGQYLFVIKDETEKIPIPMSFERWLEYCFRAFEKNFLSILRYHDVIECYKNLFGKNNVSVLLFEEFSLQPGTFIEKLSNILNVDSAVSQDLLSGKHDLPSLNRFELFQFRLKSMLLPKAKINMATMQRKGRPGRRTKHPEIPGEIYDRLAKLYREGNAQLASEYDLPLKKYGYPL